MTNQNRSLIVRPVQYLAIKAIMDSYARIGEPIDEDTALQIWFDRGCPLEQEIAK